MKSLYLQAGSWLIDSVSNFRVWVARKCNHSPEQSNFGGAGFWWQVNKCSWPVEMSTKNFETSSSLNQNFSGTEISRYFCHPRCCSIWILRPDKLRQILSIPTGDSSSFFNLFLAGLSFGGAKFVFLNWISRDKASKSRPQQMANCSFQSRLDLLLIDIILTASCGSKAHDGSMGRLYNYLLWSHKNQPFKVGINLPDQSYGS